MTKMTKLERALGGRVSPPGVEGGDYGFETYSDRLVNDVLRFETLAQARAAHAVHVAQHGAASAGSARRFGN